MILQSHELEVGYGRRTLLNRLTLSVPPGKVIALLGVNGSGKSTLLRTLSGLQPVLGGELEIGGSKASHLSASGWAKKVSIVLTERTDTANLDVYSLVALGRIPYTGRPGVLRSEDHLRVALALQQTGMSGYAQRLVKSLSDGERQRVMIARALAQETPLVVLDEPTAFLDVVNRRKVMQLLRELAASHTCSFLLSTHEMNLALEYADNWWIIDEQHILHVFDSRAAAEKRIALLFG